MDRFIVDKAEALFLAGYSKPEVVKALSNLGVTIYNASRIKRDLFKRIN